MELYRKRNKFYSNLYPNDLFEKLEFDKILELLEAECESVLGQEQVRNIKFYTKQDQIEKQLKQVHEFALILGNEAAEFPSTNYLSLKEEINILGINNSVLGESQVFKIYKVIGTVSSILHFFQNQDGENQEFYPELARLTSKIELDKELQNSIKTVIDDNGKIKSSASKELGYIRNQIGHKYQELDSKFRSAINQFKKAGYLDETIESVRNGRRVLAVLSSFKRKIKGIICDESGSGRITFMEPETTMQVNNELFELQHEEKREIHRILKDLTLQLRPFVESFKDYQKLLAILDFIRAKAKFAKQMDAIMPTVNPDRIIEMNNAYHPLLLLMNKEQKKETVPMSLRLSIAERILVISGPNAGGKSVTLKTVGLLQLMFQSGMLIPVEEGTLMCIFNNVFADIGDEQSLENDLSTYSSRLLNMRYFSEHADSKTLILIDEFGSGTDPKFGGAIAEAVLESLNKKRVYGLITTHYSNIKIFASETKGLVNGTMNFDKKNLRPLYKLEVGRPGSSFAFEIATSCGLPQDVLENAKEKVGGEYLEFDDLLSSLQNERAVLSMREDELRKREEKCEEKIRSYEFKAKELKKKKQNIILAAEKEALNIVQNTNKKYDKMLSDWSSNKEDKKGVRKIKEEIEQDRTKIKTDIEELRDEVLYRKSAGELVVGASVQLRDSEQVGKVVDLKNSNAIVEFGSMRTRVKAKELVVVERIKHEKRPTPNYDKFRASVEFSNNVDVRGMRRDEALKEVERLLDKAMLVEANYLKIIHGRGDGILRRSIREYLKQYNEVKSIKNEDPQYGGDGISIVELA